MSNICNNCGNQIPDNSKFCSICGSPVVNDCVDAAMSSVPTNYAQTAKPTSVAQVSIIIIIAVLLLAALLVCVFAVPHINEDTDNENKSTDSLAETVTEHVSNPAVKVGTEKRIEVPRAKDNEKHAEESYSFGNGYYDIKGPLRTKKAQETPSDVEFKFYVNGNNISEAYYYNHHPKASDGWAKVNMRRNGNHIEGDGLGNANDYFSFYFDYVGNGTFKGKLLFGGNSNAAANITLYAQ